MSKYSERLARTKEQISADSISSAETAAKFEIKEAILKAEKQLVTLSSAKEAALGANPFSLAKVIQISKEEEEAKALKATAEKLLVEEFN